jgi:hypothetical protein
MNTSPNPNYYLLQIREQSPREDLIDHVPVDVFQLRRIGTTSFKCDVLHVLRGYLREECKWPREKIDFRV